MPQATSDTLTAWLELHASEVPAVKLRTSVKNESVTTSIALQPEHQEESAAMSKALLESLGGKEHGNCFISIVYMI